MSFELITPVCGQEAEITHADGVLKIRPAAVPVGEQTENRKADGTKNEGAFSANMINPDHIVYSIRYSPGRGALVRTSKDETIVGSGFIEVKEGETYCISGNGIHGTFPTGNHGGFFSAESQYIVDQKEISKISFYGAHGTGAYFSVPKGLGIKYVCINLDTNEDKTSIAGTAKMEAGENPTDSQDSYLAVPQKRAALNGNTSPDTKQGILSSMITDPAFGTVAYPGLSDKIPVFRRHWIRKDKDLVVVNTGTSLTARDYCKAHEDAAYRPPLMHTYNLASMIWDKIKWENQQYRRYDAKTDKNETSLFFKETGDFSTVETDPLWDDSSYRRCYTRLAQEGNNSVEFTVPSQAWQFNFIYRTDAQGCSNCSVCIGEGNGFMEVWNGKEWVEANGYSFSMKQEPGISLPEVKYKDPRTNKATVISNVKVGGNTIYQKRLKMRCTTHDSLKPDGTQISAGTEKHVTISGTGRFMYWGVEWSSNQYMITFINAARGSHGPLIRSSGLNLIHYQDTEIWEFQPDLMLTEDPIFNGGGGSARTWFAGKEPVLPSTYFATVSENFFFADNQVSMQSRAKTLFGNDYNLEFCIFNSYATALDGKVSDYGDLREFTLSDGVTWSTYTAQLSIFEFMKTEHPDIIYINCGKKWLELCKNMYGGIAQGTAPSGKEGDTLTADGVHPNTNGSIVWGLLILPLFDFIY